MTKSVYPRAQEVKDVLVLVLGSIGLLLFLFLINFLAIGVIGWGIWLVLREFGLVPDA